MDKIVMIVAGGKGTRMKADTPKQFILLNGRPLIMHTLEIFRKYDDQIRIILVLPEVQLETWEKLCSEYKFEVNHDVGIGGETRFHSVKNNLFMIHDECLVGIHDGVRPLVSLKTIERCYEGAMANGNAIPCIRIPETLRKIEASCTVQVDRDQYRLIQTPQVFRGDIIRKAYLQEYQTGFTDDAGVVENAGYKIHLVEGNPENIKITYNNDLRTAEFLMMNN